MAAIMEARAPKSPKEGEGDAFEGCSDGDSGDGDSDGHRDGDGDGDVPADGVGSDSGSTHAPAQPIEWLATTRARRSTAGNRMKAMLANEEAAATPDGDDELELLFADDGNEDDVGFSEDDKEGASDVQMDSSSDDEDDNGADADELEGEKELERQARQQRAADRKRKSSAQDAIPAKFRKKKRVRIEEQPGMGTGTGTGTATPTSSAAARAGAATTLAAGADSAVPQQPRPRPKKKKKPERISWLPNAADMPTRASERHTTRISKEQLHHRMVADEKRRKKILEQMERKAALAEATKRPPLTQAERLAEAALVERRNAKSLNRWEEAEKQREEERLRKIAALNSRKLDGPVVTFWSGIQELGAAGEGEGAMDKHVGLMVAIEEKPQRKKRSSAAAAAAPGPPSATTPADSGIQADGTTPASASAPTLEPSKPVIPVAALMEAAAPPATPASPFTRATLAPPAQSPVVVSHSSANPRSVPLLAPTFTTSSLAAPGRAAPAVVPASGEVSSSTRIHVPTSPSTTYNPDQRQIPSGFPVPPVIASPSQKGPCPAPSRPASSGDGATSQVVAPPHGQKAPLPLSSPADAPAAVVPPAITPSQPVSAPAGVPAQPLALAAGPSYQKAIFAPVLPAGLTLDTNIPVPANSDPLRSALTPAASALLTAAPTPRTSAPGGSALTPSTPATAKPKPARKSKKTAWTPEVPETPAAETPVEPLLEGKVTRSCIILQNFDDDAIKDRQVQTQILFGRKMNKLTKPVHPPLCVITSHPARYRDPKTGLPYYNGYAYREIQRLHRGDYKWSRLIGAWVGPGTYAASNVPGRFLDPSKKRTTPTPAQAKSEGLGGTSPAVPAGMEKATLKPGPSSTAVATAGAPDNKMAHQTASLSVAPAPALTSFPTKPRVRVSVQVLEGAAAGAAAGAGAGSHNRDAPVGISQGLGATAQSIRQPAPQPMPARTAPVLSSWVDQPLLQPTASPAAPSLAATSQLPTTKHSA